MKILIVSPAGRGARTGNRTTTLRWARILRDLGHRVRLAGTLDGSACDLLIALHALKSHDAVRRFRAAFPSAPIVVGLGGTDLYRDLRHSHRARLSLELADRLVVLQPLALRALPRGVRHKARVIYQSVAGGSGRARNRRPAARVRGAAFNICVIGHLRPLKDPLRPAMAARRLPAHSRIRVLQAGGAMSEAMGRRARREARLNSRYRWLGTLNRARALAVMRRSQAIVVPSLIEGGANVIGEAVTLGVPVLASRIDGNVGLLGKGYSGYFAPGDTLGLARLLLRMEDEPVFLRNLANACALRRPLFSPERERDSWRALLEEIEPQCRTPRARRGRKSILDPRSARLRRRS